ncbi:MAG: DUF192 domain-containing protein [Planctomycetes bacterium]|nr:DUF192 domain-containing protein [Planctomycetota bacterium]
MKTPSYQLVQVATGEVIVARLEVADSFWPRFRGLQLRRLAADAGLLIVPCRSVHTCFMLAPIDVVMLDRAGRVVSMVSSLKPWRMFTGPGDVFATLELPAGTCRLKVGDQVRLVGDGSAVERYFK